MKIKFLLWSFFVLFTVYFFAQNADADFEKANRLYAQKDFFAALNVYKQIENKNDSVWHNMGNCAFYLQKYPHAFVYWQRAIDDTSFFNKRRIQKLQAMIPGCNAELSWYNYLIGVCQNVISLFSLLTLQLLFLIVWFLFCALCFAQGRSFSTYASFFIVILVFLMLVCKVKGDYIKGFAREGFSLYIGPNVDYKKIADLEKINVVQIYECVDGWYKISVDNQVGWVEKKHIKRV